MAANGTPVPAARVEWTWPHARAQSRVWKRSDNGGRDGDGVGSQGKRKGLAFTFVALTKEGTGRVCAISANSHGVHRSWE